MRIESSSIVLRGEHAAVSRVEEHLRIERWDAGAPARDRADLSPAARASADAASASADGVDECDRCGCDGETGDLRSTLIKQLLEKWLGRPIATLDPEELRGERGRGHEDHDGPGRAGRGRALGRSDEGGPGMSVDWSRTVVEAESTSFSARGTVTTADGRTIELDVSATLERAHAERQELHLEAGSRKRDPLVLDLTGAGTTLTSEKLAFDLDANGEANERISFVGPGSAFLALDRDGDGRVGDGSELFGARTGDGFAELAALDDDHDGWLDEDDAAYDRLRLWRGRDAAGADTLVSLRDAGVGAIFLGSAATPFSLTRSTAAAEDGSVRSTGMWLAEDGGAGTVRQIDLTV